jgi:hypothetical protein
MYLTSCETGLIFNRRLMQPLPNYPAWSALLSTLSRISPSPFPSIPIIDIGGRYKIGCPEGERCLLFPQYINFSRHPSSDNTWRGSRVSRISYLHCLVQFA